MKKFATIGIISMICIMIVQFAVSFQNKKSNNSTLKNDSMNISGKQREIYFAGGCFWGTEHFFKQVRGVVATEVGYANGNKSNPTYKEVVKGNTNFAETVKVIYDPEVIDLSLLIDLYFKTIDPTSLNKQGNDIGTQYRTGVYYTDKKDFELIKDKINELALTSKVKVVVENEPLKNFYKAEDYHQDYLDVNPGGYCHIGPELFEMARKANPKK